MLLTVGLVSASITRTPIYSKPETLEPLSAYYPSGTTTLHPNGQPLFNGLGWTIVGALTYWQACLTNDGDTSYAKYIYLFGYSNLLLYYDDLMDGDNPPTDNNVKITEVRTYATVKLTPSGFPYAGACNFIINGWGLSPRPASISGLYVTYLKMTYNNIFGSEIRVADVNSIMSQFVFAGFINILQGRLTETYIEVDWVSNTPITETHLVGGHYLGGHYGGS